MSEAPAAQRTLDTVVSLQYCAHGKRFHHYECISFVFLHAYSMGNRAFQDNALFHIFQRLYACSGIIALVRDICHLSLLSRVDDGDTWACERKAQSFCLHTRKYMNVSACCTPCTLYSFSVRKLNRWSLSRQTTSASRSKLPVQMIR